MEAHAAWTRIIKAKLARLRLDGGYLLVHAFHNIPLIEPLTFASL